MIPELGHFALWLALGVSLVLGTCRWWGAATRPRRLDGAGAAGARWLFALLAIAFGCLTVGASSTTTSRCCTWPATPTARCR
jgi:cytochrome c-type biogenesis protein CcmF